MEDFDPREDDRSPAFGWWDITSEPVIYVMNYNKFAHTYSRMVHGCYDFSEIEDIEIPKRLLGVSKEEILFPISEKEKERNRHLKSGRKVNIKNIPTDDDIPKWTTEKIDEAEVINKLKPAPSRDDDWEDSWDEPEPEPEAEPEGEEFKTEIVISVYTNRMLTTDSSEIYDILNYLLDLNLIESQLPWAIDKVNGFIENQHPQLRKWKKFQDEINTENWQEYVEIAHKLFGKTLWLKSVLQLSFSEKYSRIISKP